MAMMCAVSRTGNLVDWMVRVRVVCWAGSIVLRRICLMAVKTAGSSAVYWVD